MTNPAPKPEKDEAENLPKARKAAPRHKRTTAPRRLDNARRTAEPLPSFNAHALYDPEAPAPIEGAASALVVSYPAAPLQPSTPPKQSDLAEEVGAKLAIFEDMVFPTPAQIATMRKMDTLRHMGLHQASSVQHLSYDRLVEAIDAWCLADGTIDHNPLRLRRTGEAKYSCPAPSYSGSNRSRAKP